VFSFKTIIQKFASKGAQSGWTYVDMPMDVVLKLKLENRREFRIKGTMDDVKFERLVCFPAKEGHFIIALNADLRKKLGKKEGAMLSIKFEVDKSGALKSQELLDCLAEEPEAFEHFKTLTPSHQNYFHQYVLSAKGADTRAGRIVNTINAMYKKMDYGEMVRDLKVKKV